VPAALTRENLVRLERLEIDTPLGLRFWDPVTASFVSDGLIVTAHRRPSPDWTMTAAPNRRGVFVLHSLSVRREPEAESGPQGSPPSAAPQVSDLIVTVRDELGRFQPYRFPIVGPMRGLFDWAEADLSPVAAAPDLPLFSLPLFSTPGRAVPAGMGVVRAELRQVDPEDPQGREAPWAVLDVNYRDRLLGRGMADRQGHLAVILPYPPPAISSTGSGVPGPALPLCQQSWTIEIDVRFHAPDPAAPPPDDPVLSRHPERRFPDLSEALSGPLVAVQDATSPGSPPGMLSLTYGQETIIRTLGKSELFFTHP
jgi:hypothetical protein